MATPALTRRAMCGTIAAALSAPHIIPFAEAEPVADDVRLIALCCAHIALEPVIEALWSRHVDAWQQAVAEIGDCPTTIKANQAWWERYRCTAAWTTEDDHHRAADRQCRLMNEIIATPALTVTGLAAKLDLWRRTDADYGGAGNYVLWDSLADDLEAFCGVRIAPAPMVV